jgi:lysophospholipase L1-like esterase
MSLADIQAMKALKLAKQNSSLLTEQEKVVVNKSIVYDNTAFSDGVEMGATFLKRYTIAEPCHSLKLVYTNWYLGGNSEAENPDDIIVKASIDLGSGLLIPVKFNGKKTGTINGGSYLVSDEIGIEFNKDDTFLVRTYVSVDTAGKKWLLTWSPALSGEGKIAADVTEGGTLTYVAAPGLYKPVAVIGKSQSKRKSALLVGDSIFWGSGDNTSNVDPHGYGQIAMKNNNNPYMAIPRVTERANHFATITNRQFRIQLAKYCDFALCDYGINDVRGSRTLDQIKADLQTVWGVLVKRGLPVFQSTITPATTSTDAWATVANQTIDATNSVRTQLNDWIRTTPSPLSGYFEIADLAETSRNSGIWKAGYTDDGLHPNTTAHYALAAGIDVSKLPR